MLLIQRLYIKELLKVLALLAFGLSLFFSILGLIERTEELLPYKPSASLLAYYALLGVPKFLRYILPMSVLLASLFVFSQAVRRLEIVSIKAAGGSIKSLMRPFMMLGLLLALFAFGVGEIVQPFASRELQSIRHEITGKDRQSVFKQGTLFLRGRDGSVIRIGLFMPAENVYKDVTIFKYDIGGLRETIRAEKAEWTEGGWTLSKVMVYGMAQGTVREFKDVRSDAIESPEIFEKEAWKAEEMTLVDLVQFQRRLNESGYRNVSLSVDISSRVSFPLINFFLLLLGISLAFGDISQRLIDRVFPGASSHAGIVSAGLGLVISLAFWFGHSFFISLGYAGTIPPLIAPWILPSFFAVLSLYLFAKIPE